MGTNNYYLMVRAAEPRFRVEVGPSMCRPPISDTWGPSRKPGVSSYTLTRLSLSLSLSLSPSLSQQHAVQTSLFPLEIHSIL